MELLGRSEETLTVDRLLGSARGGFSGVLVVRGEPGIGKTAILDHAVEGGIGAGFRVVRVVGIQAEQELGYAALHRLLVDLLPQREVLPPPQRDALEVAFGLASGARADRFLIGLAVLTLVGEAANDRPVLWVCDDAQWLDRETLEVLAFLGRRLEADRVVLLMGVRDGAAAADILDDLPVLLVGGLQGRPARELVERSTAGRLDAAVAGRVVAEAQGNPLALRELAVDVAGAHPDTSQVPLSARLPLGRQLEAAPGPQERAASSTPWPRATTAASWLPRVPAIPATLARSRGLNGGRPRSRKRSMNPQVWSPNRTTARSSSE
ncbi:ATP-binding protein [Actinomycetospora flava]|uniref:ATP-binding protein n=1 Tax=Actinomycetospora flava TaxID=3129232 RepID=A0ABU8MAI5_9PSEU